MSNRRVYIVTGVTAVGGFLYGYDTGVINGVATLPQFQSLVGITASNYKDSLGWIVVSLQIGGTLGALGQSSLLDGIGRKNSILTHSIIFLIGAIMQTCASDFYWFCSARFISGYGLCVIGIAVQVYNAEVSPASIRGRVVGLQQFMVAFGIACSYWVNYGIRMHNSWTGAVIQYILPLGLQVVPPILLFLGLLYLPKSPRWLASKGDYIAARQALSFIRSLPQDSPEIDSELGDISSFLESNPTSTWTEVLAPANLRRIFIGVPLILFQQFSGQNVINYFSPALFQQLGLTSNNLDLLATGGIGVIKMLTTLPALWAVDRLGRRPLMIYGTTVMAFAFYYIGVFSLLSPPGASNGFTVWGYLAIIMVYVFMAGYAMSWGIIHYVLPAEIYPFNIRAKTHTIGAVTDWGFQVISIKIYPYIIGLGSGGLYFGSAGLLSLFLVWIVIWLPETKGLKLEEVERAFNVFPRWKQISKEVQSEVSVDEHAPSSGNNTVSKKVC